MKTVVIGALATLMCAPAWAQSPADFSAIDTKLNACLAQRPDNPGAANCETAALIAADQRLNEVYAGVKKVLEHPGANHAAYNPEVVKRLVAAERSWIAFRDAECSYQSTVALGAPLEGFEYVACRYAKTKERVAAFTAHDAPQNAR